MSNNENNEKEYYEIKHSTIEMASYSSGRFIWEFLQGILILLLFYFYEVEVGLPSWMTGVAIAIYAIWDAVNDPFLGYLTDRPFRFTKKLGRRFPWIVGAFIPMLVMFYLIFTPPAVNAQEQPWIIFAWFVINLCIFDTFETIYSNNWLGLYPDKFRSKEERIKVSGILVYIGMIGLVLANILPPLLIIEGNLASYSFMALISIVINFFAWLTMLPGSRDDKATVVAYIEKYDEIEKPPFFESLKRALTHKALLAFLAIYFCYVLVTNLVQGSFIYWVDFIIFGGTDLVTFLMLFLLIGVMIGIPIWKKYSEKTGNNRKSLLYAAIVLSVFTFFMSFITTFLFMLIFIIIWGIALAGFWLMRFPVFSDVVDESISQTKARRESFYSGIRTFVNNSTKAIQAFLFSTVHILTGFVQTAETQSTLANIGILLLFGIIPALFLAVGTIIFWKYYDITPERSKEVKGHIRELKI